MGQVFLNNFRARLSADVLAADTVLPLAAGAGLPTWNTDDWMWITLTQNGSETSWEIVKATQWSTDSLDVVERAQQGTTAVDWPAGSKAQNRATAADLGGGGVTLSDQIPQTHDDEGAGPGTSDEVSRADHVHPQGPDFQPIVPGHPGGYQGNIWIPGIRSTHGLVPADIPDSGDGSVDNNYVVSRKLFTEQGWETFNSLRGTLAARYASVVYGMAFPLPTYPDPYPTIDTDLAWKENDSIILYARDNNGTGPVVDSFTGTVAVYDPSTGELQLHYTTHVGPTDPDIWWFCERPFTAYALTDLDASLLNILWGAIEGNINNQSDLISLLNEKQGASPTLSWLSGLAVPDPGNVIPVLSGATGEGSGAYMVTLDRDPDLAANSDHAIPSQDAVKAYVDATKAAAESYADGLVVGLVDDRGNWDASGNVFPSTGGSGPAGAILKGDLWTISVQGALGGTVVYVGSSIRALVDAPGQTAGNWAMIQQDLGYVPVPNSRTVNGHPLTADVTVTAADVGAPSGSGTSTGNNTGDQTFIPPRVASTASSVTPTPNLDTTDLFMLTAQAATAAFANPTGTPANGQLLMVWMKDDGTSRSITWGSSYANGGVALPTGTLPGKWLMLGFRWNATASKLYLVSAAQEP